MCEAIAESSPGGAALQQRALSQGLVSLFEGTRRMFLVYEDRWICWIRLITRLDCLSLLSVTVALIVY